MAATPSAAKQIETSIIVRTFNEARHLPALFETFDQQTYRDFEVIVVDSGSFDDTRRIAEARADQLLRIASEDFTFGFALNLGIRAARGDYIAIVSAHTIPVGANWLETLIRPLKDEPDVAMVYGRQCGVPSSRFGEAEDLERIFGPRRRVEGYRRMAVNNANAAIRKSLWSERQFDDRLLGLEDIEWAKHWMDRGHRVLYEPDSAILHIHEENWAQIRRRYYREAFTARRMDVMGRRHIPRIIMEEQARLFVDLAHAFISKSNPVAQRLTVTQRLREAVYFRFHKTVGTIRGLLDTHITTNAQRHQLLFDRHYDAVVIQGPNQAQLKYVPIPEIKPGEVLIEVAHVAVCATDLEVVSGSLGYFASGLSSFPIVPGHEFSGRVVAKGHNVKNLSEGDRVVVEPIQSCGTCSACRAGNNIGCPDRAELGVMRRDGAYARYVSTAARFVHRIPENVDLRRAALTEPLAVVLKGLRRLHGALDATKAQRCVVLGAGPLGHLVAKVLALRGHSVTVIDRNPNRLGLFQGTGIATGGINDRLEGFDCLVEVTGDPDVLHRALVNAPANTTFLLLGLPYGTKEFSFESIAAYDKTVVGSVGSTQEDFVAALNLLPQLDLAPYFECPMPLEQFAQAWTKSASGETLKVILDVAGAQPAHVSID